MIEAGGFHGRWLNCRVLTTLVAKSCHLVSYWKMGTWAIFTISGGSQVAKISHFFG